MPQFTVDDLHVELVRKNIRSLRLTVYATDGRVRVAAPLRTPDEAIRAFVAARRAWIRKHQQQFEARPKLAVPEYVSGETHFYLGRPHQLHVQPAAGAARVVLMADDATLALYAPADSTREQREKALHAWYRARLKEQLPAVVAQWEPVVGVRADTWAVKRMTTRWGTCNIRARRIWLNLELIKHAPHCLAYVVVHELVHLHERLHNPRFWGLMDQFMPDWRAAQQLLKSTHLKPCS
ncbi:M48 family metallopeptidase [Hymenobacter persicinus]|uniref:M48 family peptidase n=1 Tax=Hymenobacter persicinus TaxID=2025506 RepID=A0A4Q5LHN8_9BACT|nr:SprT family zinc-dependent metalloprotease [Hymenobacter persicinus]RYU81851.1 M48 family peptidase [Hymenobacter persicinus]